MENKIDFFHREWRENIKKLKMILNTNMLKKEKKKGVFLVGNFMMKYLESNCRK